MIPAVCRRVLRDHQAAEDAAQATWLVAAEPQPFIGREY